MGKVIELDAYRPHASGPAKCVGCGHSWVAVALLGVYRLTCPACSLEKGVWYGLHAGNPDTPHWACTCGNNLFTVEDDRIVCARCGIETYLSEL